MPYPLKYHLSDHIYHLTCRTRDSKLWFVNNPELCDKMVGVLAKYKKVYEVDVFSFIIMGNHYHLIARFPKCNKSPFMRILNSMFAKLTKEYTDFPGGPLWHSRYREQTLLNYEDVEYMFFYCALNPVYSGLVEDATTYSGYNSYRWIGESKDYKVFNKTEYHKALERDKSIQKKDYLSVYSLEYMRIPGYESLSLDDYKNIIAKKYNEAKLEATKNKTFPPLKKNTKYNSRLLAVSYKTK